MNKPQPSQLEAKVESALVKGPICAIGGIVYDHAMTCLGNTTDLYHAVQALNKRGIKVGRTDSGGSPTWAITQSD